MASGEILCNRNFKFIALSLAFAIACGYITFYHVFCILQQKYRMEANYALLDSQIDFFQRQMGTVQSANEQLRVFRHDIRHYIAMQFSCLENGNVGEAKKILTSLENNLGEIAGNAVQYTNSPFLNGVIANYADKAKNAGIRFDVKLSAPEDGDEKHIELAVVISNALENAWKACLKIPEGDPRMISLMGRQDKNQYFLEIANTYCGTIRFNKDHTIPITDQDGHGYGTRSIIAFAEKHGAYVEFKEEDGLFKVRLIF